MEVASLRLMLRKKDEIWFHPCLNLSSLFPSSTPQPPPFYDYYVIYSHMKRSNISQGIFPAIIVWLLFYESNFPSFSSFSRRRIKFVKNEMKNCEKKRNKCKFLEYLIMQMWKFGKERKKCCNIREKNFIVVWEKNLIFA